jgi:hypothetical protein
MKWLMRHWRGILLFGEKNDAWDGELLPQMLEPKSQVTANALVFGPLIFGVALLMWSFERGQDQRGIPGGFCANWLRIHEKVPSKSLIA